VPVVRVDSIDRIPQDGDESGVGKDLRHTLDGQLGVHIARGCLTHRGSITSRLEVLGVSFHTSIEVPVEEANLLGCRHVNLRVAPQIACERGGAAPDCANDQECGQPHASRLSVSAVGR
jgi:acetylornithine deacetylase/succinyl-diaminopimelate desuccinylase-like protein